MRNKMVLGAVLVLLVIAVASAAGYILFIRNNDSDNDSDTNQEESSSSEDDNSLRIDLNSKSDINQYGTATIKEENEKLAIELSLVNSPSTVQPVHIHRGTCDAPGEIIVNLTNVVNGRSSSVVDLTLDAVNDGNHVITGHRSAEALGTYDFCGVIQ